MNVRDEKPQVEVGTPHVENARIKGHDCRRGQHMPRPELGGIQGRFGVVGEWRTRHERSSDQRPGTHYHAPNVSGMEVVMGAGNTA
jgi:hypothetical protein